VPNLAARLADLANWFYDFPSTKLNLIGITGTNGKTTTSSLMAQMLHSLDQRVALMGTLGAGIYPHLHATGHTTPDLLTIQAWLADAVAQGCQFAVMEVSSHAVVQARIAGLQFRVKALTQVTEDHLDFHGSLQAYHQAKQDFFYHYPADQLATETWILNQVDAIGQTLLSAPLACGSTAKSASHSGLKRVSYSAHPKKSDAQSNADLQLLKQRLSHKGFFLSLCWQQQAWSVKTVLLGDYNLENLCCCLTTALVLGFCPDALTRVVPKLVAPSGRLERVACQKPLNVVVDFAHTTDALRQVLLTLNKQRSALDNTAALWVVFGCGGDRDKTKRPAMTAVAYQLADHLILTSDNPRSEQIDAIFADMLAGLPPGYDPLKIRVQPNRQLAIEAALAGAKEGDWVVIAGKGHETIQEINGIYFAFSDQQVIKDWTP
jgi:UDP-N-acetylmuramoyl-L-alanyl-D-glutamate--2,6-diaminopimelate ligase